MSVALSSRPRRVHGIASRYVPPRSGSVGRASQVASTSYVKHCQLPCDDREDWTYDRYAEASRSVV